MVPGVCWLVAVPLLAQPGSLDLSFDPGPGPNRLVYALAVQVKNEYCVALRGLVRERPAGMKNASMATVDDNQKLSFQCTEKETR